MDLSVLPTILQNKRIVFVTAQVHILLLAKVLFQFLRPTNLISVPTMAGFYGSQRGVLLSKLIIFRCFKICLAKVKILVSCNRICNRKQLFTDPILVHLIQQVRVHRLQQLHGLSVATHGSQVEGVPSVMVPVQQRTSVQQQLHYFGVS